MTGISIIICSRNKNIEKPLLDNISATVGCPYELIVIDNSNNNHSIFEAYNIGIDKSKGDILCLMHDDILIHTKKWGEILLDHFSKNSKTGLMGVAGSKIKTKMPSAWWDCPRKFKVVNITQHFNGKEKEKWQYGFKNGTDTEVVAIDGVFMGLRKNRNIRFDENLKGFHNYDLNISLEYKIAGYSIFATNKIEIEHFSIGSINKCWYKSTLQFHKKYGKYLPLSSGENFNKKHLKSLELQNGRFFLNGLIKNGFKREAFYIWSRLVTLKPFSKFHLQFLQTYLKK